MSIVFVFRTKDLPQLALFKLDTDDDINDAQTNGNGNSPCRVH